MKWVIVLCGLISFPVFGEDLCDAYRIQINGFSKHTDTKVHATDQYGKGFDLDIQYNEVNPGIGITCDTSESVSLSIGQYKNSYYNNSTYAGIEYHTRVIGDSSGWGLEIGVEGIIASGYGERITDGMVKNLPDGSSVVRENYQDTIVLPLTMVNLAYKNIAKLKVGYAPRKLLGANGTDIITINAEIAPWRF